MSIYPSPKQNMFIVRARKIEFKIVPKKNPSDTSVTLGVHFMTEFPFIFFLAFSIILLFLDHFFFHRHL
eukprot:TRINITY_DN2485_c0_g1_i1.p2 TRINITY_DN2485_c0_g1~~TRINITY_DN2485_c0_g1_i1.p2  ORF type:complete len:69 (+),score=0.86 TRINITY_DN2485_c0_g1_i1:60-266(+)